MPKPSKGARLGGSPTHERHILRNLAAQLFQHGRITTTETKARRLQPVAEKLITKAKRGDIHSRRLVLQSITDKHLVKTLFDEIAPTFADRDGGYTRITKIGPRKGDNAPLAVIELVTESVEESRENKKKAGKAVSAKAAAPVEEPAAEETVEAEVVADEAAAEAEVVEAPETEEAVEAEVEEAEAADEAEAK